MSGQYEAKLCSQPILIDAEDLIHLVKLRILLLRLSRSGAAVAVVESSLIFALNFDILCLLLTVNLVDQCLGCQIVLV